MSVSRQASAAGRALGRLAAGKPKNYSPEERARRAEWARGLAARRKVKVVSETNQLERLVGRS